MYGVERIQILDTRVRGRINEGKVVESTRACDGEHVIIAHGCLRQPYPKDRPVADLTSPVGKYQNVRLLYPEDKETICSGGYTVTRTLLLRALLLWWPISHYARAVLYLKSLTRTVLPKGPLGCITSIERPDVSQQISLESLYRASIPRVIFSSSSLVTHSDTWNRSSQNSMYCSTADASPLMGSFSASNRYHQRFVMDLVHSMLGLQRVTSEEE